MTRPSVVIDVGNLSRPMSHGGRTERMTRAYVVVMPGGRKLSLNAWCELRGLPVDRFRHVLKTLPAGTYTHLFDLLTDYVIATETGESETTVRLLERRLFVARRDLGVASRRQMRSLA